MSEEKIDLLLTEIQNLKQEITEMKQSCERMDNHISFIERIYETLKAPIHYLQTYYTPQIEY